MVKMLAGFILVHIVNILECAAVAGFTVAAGIVWGRVGIIVALSTFALLKSFELDIKAKQ